MCMNTQGYVKLVDFEFASLLADDEALSEPVGTLGIKCFRFLFQLFEVLKMTIRAGADKTKLNLIHTYNRNKVIPEICF